MSQFAWTADAQGSTYWYNKRWHDYAGTTLEEMQGWGWQKVHHPDHVDRVVNRIRQCFAAGSPWEDTFPLRGKDGTYRWFLSRALPIRNEAGDLVRWFGTLTDVNEQIEAEKALRNLERNAGAARRNGGSGTRPNLERIAGSSGRRRHGRPICRGQSGLAARSAGPKATSSTRRSNGWSILTILQKLERNRLASPTAAIRCISKIVSGISTARTAGCRGRRSPKRAKFMVSPETSPISRIRRINCEFRAGNLPR